MASTRRPDLRARPGRYSVSRQKACQQCVFGKARCDKNPEGCSRCLKRGHPCSYASLDSGAPSPSSSSSRAEGLSQLAASMQAPPDSNSHRSPSVSFSGSISAANEPPFDPGSWPSAAGSADLTTSNASSPSFAYTGSSVGRAATTSSAEDRLRFSCLDLVCPIPADEVGTRWMNVYLPVADGPPIKDYPPSVASLIARVLDSYARSASRGRGVPSFLHWTQLPSRCPSLATCLNIVRICERPMGSDSARNSSDPALAEVLKREMGRLYEEMPTWADDGELIPLSAFQAYLIYIMVLYFRLDIAGVGKKVDGKDDCDWFPFFRQAASCLDEMASAAVKRGIACMAEMEGQRTRPIWESWIVTEAKRRTVYVMYLFENELCRHQELATFLGTELRGLPAPGSKALWEAKSRREWEARYNEHLAEWEGEGGLCIEELWGTTGLDETAARRRRKRVDRWLEGVDEFGMMIYVVTSCTHGT